MKSNIISSLILGSVAMLAVSSAQAFTEGFTVRDYTPPPNSANQGTATKAAEAAWLASMFVGGNTDINIVPGSASSSASYMYMSGVTSDGRFVLSNGGFLGYAPGRYGSTGVESTFKTGGNAALAALIGVPTNQTFDQNVLTFQFTVNDPSLDTITTSFIFASDEFGKTNNNDVFAFWVDGVNYALLPDGSVVSVKNIGSNWVDGKDHGYYGRTEEMTITALLDPTLTVHTISIGIADAANAAAGISTVFLGSFAVTSSNPTIPAIPEPETWAMMLAGLGLVGVTAKRRRRQG